MFAVVLRQARRALAVAMAMAVLFLLLENGCQRMLSAGCYTDVFEKPEIAGYSFEISETDCWHSPHVSVFIISWHGGKTRLFQYTRYTPRDGPNPYPLPVIKEIDQHTIQISLVNAHEIDCLTERWGQLQIKYDIGFVARPDPDDRAYECTR